MDALGDQVLLTTGYTIGYARFNVEAGCGWPKWCRCAERRLEEIEPSGCSPPSIRAIIEALYGAGAQVAEFVQLCWRQLVADTNGTGGKPDERIIATGDERIRQILSALPGRPG